MATLANINKLRIAIADPEVNKITVIAALENLPANPTPQTAYYITAKEYYMQTELTSGASQDDYEIIETWLSNIVIDDLIDTYGYDKAVYKAIRLIAAKLGKKLLIVKNTAGADSIEYIKLLDWYKYYKSIAKDFEEDEKENSNNSTGKIGRTKWTRIAGGNL